MSIGPILSYLTKNLLNKKINVIEIGARYGDSSEILIKNFNIDTYIIIDPYKSYDEYKVDGFNETIKLDQDDKIFNDVKSKLQKLHNNVIFYRNYSNNKDTIHSIEDNSIDLIFIDGNHAYKYVLGDLVNYYPKLKEGGIMCGDDFFMRKHSNDTLNTLPGKEGYDEPMVYEAVLDFCKEYNKTYTEFGIHRGYGKIFMIN